jgi:hypothetical protein
METKFPKLILDLDRNLELMINFFCIYNPFRNKWKWVDLKFYKWPMLVKIQNLKYF